jgi:hypothetical protein
LHLWDLGARRVLILIEQAIKALNYLIAKLETHTLLGHCTEQRFKDALRLVSPIIVGKVCERTSYTECGHIASISANHDVIEKIPDL